MMMQTRVRYLLCLPFAIAGLAERKFETARAEELVVAEMPPPPDNEEVLRREFNAAVELGTNAALLRFIARHGNHPLADSARRLLAARTEPDHDTLTSDPDADVYSAFDRARIESTRPAWNRFLARYPNHPLSAEARRLLGQLQ